MEINGKEYPLWSQFVDRRDEFIGKPLISEDMGMSTETIVTDVTLLPNGLESAMFTVHGEDFKCGFDVRYGGISSTGIENTIGFSTTYTGSFYIKLD